MTNYLELHTERLLLRPIKPDDAVALFTYRSDTIINQYQGWIPTTIDDVVDFIKNRIAPVINLADTWYQLVIIKKETSEIIGDIGIHFLDPGTKQVEIGCTLDKNQHGKGYATEALNVLMNYLFHELDKHRIVTSIDPKNLKSIGLVERLGFRKEAHFKESILIRGEWADDLVYAILKDEWMSRVRSSDRTI
jgi:RimJ/RimL family protein N-acetyltransferase